MTLFTNDNINTLKKWIDLAGKCKFIGENHNNNTLFLKEILALWKSNITELENIQDINESKKFLHKLNLETSEYIQQQSQIKSSNLIIVNSISRNIFKSMYSAICKQNINRLALLEKDKIKGDKTNAIKLVTALKNDFGFECIIINPTDNWDKVSIWTKKVRKNLNCLMKILDIPKEVINLNGNMSLSYVSPIVTPALMGKFSDHYNSHYTLHIRNDSDKNILSTLIHEYTHAFDRLVGYKYYEKNIVDKKDHMYNLSNYLLNEAIKGNYSFNDSFINEYQKKIVSLTNDNKIEEVNVFYNIQLQQCTNVIKKVFLTELLGKKIEHWDDLSNKNSLEQQLDETIKKIFISGKKNCNVMDSTIFNKILTTLTKEKILTIEALKEFLTNKDKTQTILNNILYNERKNSYFYKNSINDQGVFANTNFMCNVIKSSYNNNYDLAYWTNIAEVLARHTQGIKKDNYTGIYKEFFPNINNKNDYIKLLKNMISYCDLVENKMKDSSENDSYTELSKEIKIRKIIKI